MVRHDSKAFLYGVVALAEVSREGQDTECTGTCGATRESIVLKIRVHENIEPMYRIYCRLSPRRTHPTPRPCHNPSHHDKTPARTESRTSSRSASKGRGTRWRGLAKRRTHMVSRIPSADQRSSSSARIVGDASYRQLAEDVVSAGNYDLEQLEAALLI
jgi:hypothetical protein